MKKMIYFLAILSAGFISLDARAQQGFDYEISGNIKGLGNDTILMFTNFGNASRTLAKGDTIFAIGKNDRFMLKGHASRPGLVYAQVGVRRASDSNFSFVLEKGKIRINGRRDSIGKVSVSGTPSNEDYSYGNKRMNEYYDKRSALFNEYKNRSDKNDDESKQIMARAYSMSDSVTVFQTEFIKTHPASMASGMFLYLLQDKVPVRDLEAMYTSLAAPVKEFGLLARTPEKIAAKKRNVIGAQAGNFTMKDVNGKDVQLQDFKGKYVLLDFWASWCAPCRAENPPLVKAYGKFKNSGFEIVSISSDKSEVAWKKAIAQDNLTWVHLSDLSGNDNHVSKLYGVQPIPDNFLINPDGKIIARGLRGEEVYNKLSEIFPSNK